MRNANLEFSMFYCRTASIKYGVPGILQVYLAASIETEPSYASAEYFHNVSVRSLFIFAIFEETLRSMVRSPTSTTRPPLISGLT